MEIGMMVFFVGVVVYMIGNLWFLIVGFSESVLWGLAILFLGGIAGLIFAASHWDRAKGPVGLCIGGVIIALGGLGLGILDSSASTPPESAPVSIDATADPGGEPEVAPIDYEPASSSDDDRKSLLRPRSMQGSSAEPSPDAIPAPAPTKRAPAPPPAKKNPYSSGDTY